MESSHPGPACRRGQYLTFRVARNEFAVEAALVRGLLPVDELDLTVPSPSLRRIFGDWTCGFANIRGCDVPIIDLRSRLNLPHGVHGRHPCVVVIQIGDATKPRLAGFIADRVLEMVYARERNFCSGKLRLGSRSRRLLDPDVLVTPA